jgi:hypothetical protein
VRVALSSSAVLTVWERGLGLSPPRRALALLAAACPERAADELLGWSLGRRDRALMRLRAALFGPAMESVARCPACGETAELELDALALAGGDGDEDEPADPPSLEADEYRVRCRLPDSRDLLAAEAAGSVEAAREALAGRLIVTAERSDGLYVCPGALPAVVRDAALAAIDAADPAAWRAIALECPGCGMGWTAPFDPAAFLWAELDALARRLLDEVHRLAGAYGWSESEILAMGPRRREAYLERLGV